MGSRVSCSPGCLCTRLSWSRAGLISQPVRIKVAFTASPPTRSLHNLHHVVSCLQQRAVSSVAVNPIFFLSAVSSLVVPRSPAVPLDSLQAVFFQTLSTSFWRSCVAATQHSAIFTNPLTSELIIQLFTGSTLNFNFKFKLGTISSATLCSPSTDDFTSNFTSKIKWISLILTTSLSKIPCSH